MKPLQITQSPSVLLDIGLLPEKYAYEFQMLIREFLPFARFCTSEEEADLSLRIHDHQVLLIREGEQKIQPLSDGTPSLTGDPYKNRIKKAIYELLSELTGTRLPWGILTGVRPTKIAYAALDRGSSQEEIVHDLVQDFCLQEDKARLMTMTARQEKLLLSSHEGHDVSLYVGIPFCPTRCAYCSFVSYDYARYGQLADAYVDALIHEIEHSAPLLSDRRIKSFYMGGGTPTVLSPKQLEKILHTLDQVFGCSTFTEMTVEGGRPDTITPEKLRVLTDYGVNRISINPQTLHQKTLDLVGRRHTVEQIYEAFRMAREAGFKTINMDFIMGLPQETEKEAYESMQGVLRLKPENLTIHTLAIKRSSSLHQEGEGPALVRQGPMIANMLSIAQDTAFSLGMHPYYMYRQKNMAGNFENVGYSLPGQECIYNIEIMEERQSIIAFGAGAVSKIYYPEENRLERVPNVKNVTEYLSRTDEMIERKRKELRHE